MTPNQLRALRHACARANEVWAATKIGRWSVLLTVNKCLTFCDGMPVWHVSIATHGPTGPVPFANWRKKTVREAMRIARRELAGVGGVRMQFVTEPPGICLHVESPLTHEERKLLPPGWMDIMAVDERGPVRMVWV